jgi:membrane protein
VIGPMIKANLGTIPGTGASLIIGTVLLLLGARGVAAAMQNSMYVIWGIPKDRRPGFPMSLVWALALMLTVGIGLVLTTVLSGLAGGTGHVITGAGAHVATVAVSLILNVCMFWLAFRIASGHQVPWRALRTGAAIAAVFWQFLQVSGGYIIGHQLHRASELYGTFGIVLGLLAWLFLQAEVTLYAAEADVVLARRLWPQSIVPAKPGAPAEPGQQSRGRHARPEDGTSLGGQPDPDGQAAADGQAPVPSPRGEPSDSDTRAAGQR